VGHSPAAIVFDSCYRKDQGKTMAQLLIRDVEPELKVALEHRAERDKRSLEAEVCEIIRIALEKEDKETAARATR
jgi:plasmid stability protein